MSLGQRPQDCVVMDKEGLAGSPATLPVTVSHVGDCLLPLRFDVLQLGQDLRLLGLMATRQEGFSRPQNQIHLHAPLRLQLA